MKPQHPEITIYKNNEERHAATMFELQKRAGEIVDYQYEPCTFILVPAIPKIQRAVTYTPDFRVILIDKYVWYEVKAMRMKHGKKAWTSKKRDSTPKLLMAKWMNPWDDWCYLEVDLRSKQTNIVKV